MLPCLWMNVLPTTTQREPLASCWSKTLMAFVWQILALRREVQVADHVLTMLRTYLRAEEEAYVVAGAIYAPLNLHDVPEWRGIIHRRFDPWNTQN